MANFKELTQKRENLLIQIIGVADDLKEFIKYPCETVDIEQIKYQYDFILREIKEIDEKLKFILLSQSQTLRVDFELLQKQQKEFLPKENFNVNDLPKEHFSMFEKAPLVQYPFIKYHEK
jgi:hypothetical protein